MPKIGATPSPDQFQRAAIQAKAVGGMIKLDSQGNPVAQGGNWRGKAAIWAKERLMPSIAKRQNNAVLNAFQQSIDREYAILSKTAIHTMISHRKEPRLMAGEILKAADAYQETAPKAENAARQAHRFLEKSLAHGQDFELMAILAGKNPDSIKAQAKTLKSQYGRLIEQMAKNPLLKTGVIPHAGADTAELLKRSAQNYRLENGSFTDGFLKAALIAAMETTPRAEPLEAEMAPSDIQIEDYGVTGKMAEDDMAWIRQECQNALPKNEAAPAAHHAARQEVPTGQLIDL